MKKILTALKLAVLFTFIISAAILTSNLDVVVRTFNAMQTGTFSFQRLRYDLASFNIGQEIVNKPIQQKTSAGDGMIQVYVPAGEFLMGKPGEPDVNSPQRTIYLDAFWIDQVEVSNAMYEKCVDDGTCSLPALSENPYYGKWVYRNYPVAYANWTQAVAYCEWAGRRLPTEAEWEKAARGTDGRKYPWGNEAPTPRYANYAESLIGEAVPVYRYPMGASPYGALNMVGNMREWVADWFSDSYYSEMPESNPMGPDEGFERSLRSGAYDAVDLLVTKRYKHQPQSAGLSRGFRCAESDK
ncbi:MAG: formylglycine-generating enzyme family protein [Chloroflexi bacterium]|nr:formylglycine-generating enzyme family protein [Chloroflexota bacterium]